jgi:restriction system protein
MAIPGFQEMTLPLLRTCANGEEWAMAAVRGPVAQHFGLTAEQQRELLPSGTQPRFNNRVAWAKIYLERAGLLTKTRRGHFKISPAGLQVLQNPPPVIDIAFLRQFEAFDDFRTRSMERAESPELPPAGDETPEEQLQAAHQRLCDELATQLLTQINDMSFDFFEKLVLDLMLAMGYGGSREDSGSLTNAGADEGIDGIINEDQLGLDSIYLQAKKWQNTVGRPEIHKFVGALHGRRARKGVFLTTSSFSREAVEYAKTIDTKVVLIDGRRLAELMIKHNVGCNPSQTFVVKKIDSDYFAEE